MTRWGVGTTRVTLRDRGTKDSKAEATGEHHGYESMPLLHSPS
jgi:hypothetical protein